MSELSERLDRTAQKPGLASAWLGQRDDCRPFIILGLPVPRVWLNGSTHHDPLATQRSGGAGMHERSAGTKSVEPLYTLDAAKKVLGL